MLWLISEIVLMHSAMLVLLMTLACQSAVPQSKCIIWLMHTLQTMNFY
nr:MAG TPA: hypothetical protein [Bacteriophage sp.]